MIEYYRAKRAHMAQKLWQWHRAGKPDDNWLCVAVSDDFDYHHKPGEQYSQTGEPDRWNNARCEADEYELLTPENIYYDDAMRRIRAATLEHNRVAVIVQGLLDRSTCLHPHPPWRIWTPEGFAAGIELVYDVSRAITPGAAPDFEEYRRQLNKGLKTGCHTIGQYAAWREHMERTYGDKEWRYEGRHGSGPGKLCARSGLPTRTAPPETSPKAPQEPAREPTPETEVPMAVKRAYVQGQRQTRDHHCHWPGCDRQVPPAMWGCKPHWFRLPKALRDRIWKTYVPGQEIDMTPSREYLAAAGEVQAWIESQAETRK